MPNSTTAQYRLMIFDKIDDPQELCGMVREATGLHPTDVVQWLARSPGVWPQPLEEQVVRRLLDGLYEFGVAAEAWRTDQFPELSPTRTVHRATSLADGLRIEGIRGEPTHWITWDRVEMLCAGRVRAEDEFRIVKDQRWPSVVVAGIRALALRKPRPIERRQRAQRIPRDAVGELLIVRRDPRITFRVVENQMNYSYLGTKLRSTAAENFPLFVADLCARATDAYITPSTRSLLEAREPGEHDFPSSQAILDYATHRLLWSWYRRDGDAHIRPEEGQTKEDSDSSPH
jgi:hypothetical protein